MNLKHLKSLLLGTSAFVCLALAAPVLAADFTITSGATTNDGNTINGNDSVTVTGALVTTGVNEGIVTKQNQMRSFSAWPRKPAGVLWQTLPCKLT